MVHYLVYHGTPWCIVYVPWCTMVYPGITTVFFEQGQFPEDYFETRDLLSSRTYPLLSKVRIKLSE